MTMVILNKWSICGKTDDHSIGKCFGHFSDLFLLKQVHSDNDASEVDILGHFGTFLDILGQFVRLYDDIGAFRLFSQSFMTIFTHNRLIEKKAFQTDRRTDGWTDGRTDIPSYRIEFNWIEKYIFLPLPLPLPILACRVVRIKTLGTEKLN